jgi:hypothetical protein
VSWRLPKNKKKEKSALKIYELTYMMAILATAREKKLDGMQKFFIFLW